MKQLVRVSTVALVMLGFILTVGFAQEQGPPAKGKGDKKAPAKSAEKKADGKDAGPPAGIPPAAAKGYRLAQFIKSQIANGASGEALAGAINKERAKLGLTDDDKDDDAPSPKK